MGLAGLDSALTGLKASQQQINLISANVSNVNTPGYTRKILPQSSQSIAGVTVGVLTGTFTRNVDLNLQRDLWTQVSAVGQLSIQQTYLDRIEKFHGDPTQEVSVAAEIAALRDNFAALADSPEDPDILTQTLNQAVDTADKINDFSSLITQLRNDAQGEIAVSVNRINQLLQVIAETNKEIQSAVNVGRPTANYEDTRDGAVKELTGLIEISSFKRGDGVLVIQTNEGVQLADQKAEVLTFRPTPQSATTYYPASAAGVFIGDPAVNPLRAIDIADDFPGGKLGGLLNLRDTVFPQQMAQLDELAHKLAQRFDAQGLKLFVNAAGNVPLDTAPDPSTLPNPTPVPYVGFSAEIRVNQLVVKDQTLLQKGTYGATLQVGANDVIRRVLEFTFSDVSYQEAYNSDPATGVDLQNTGGADLQSWLGLHSSNSLMGGRDLSAFADVNALITSAGTDLSPPNDSFDIIFSEPRLGYTDPPIAHLTINLAAAQLQPGATAADQIAAEINAQIAANLSAAEITDMQPSASVGANGQILLNSRGSIEVDSTGGPNPMTQTGLNYLGLADSNGTPKPPVDPYFDVQVGNQDPVRVTLDPGETSASLLAKLNAIPNLVAQYDASGYLQLRPGDDPTFANQSFGGDVKVIGGAFTTNGASYGTPPASGTRATIDNNVNIASALFGTYAINAGVVDNQTPVTSYYYGSVVDGSAVIPSSIAIRQSLLGPGANVDTAIIGSSTLIDFAQKIISRQSLDLLLIKNQQTDEQSVQTTLEEQLQNDSGVNLDEELASLVVYQNAYAASARVVSAVNDLFKELMSVL
jgi:flagellar hook-associated protein 1 FlgK